MRTTTQEQDLPRHPGELVRLARTAAGWRQSELGAKCGYSASQISRWETGRAPLRDVSVMRLLAQVLDVSPQVFGLTVDDTAGPNPPVDPPVTHRVGRISTREEDDPVRRREFLTTAGLIGSSLAFGPAGSATEGDMAALVADHLADVLLTAETSRAEPATLPALRQQLTAAKADFASCRYPSLATRLRTLLAACQATLRHHDRPATHAIASETYQLTTRALIKLEPGTSGLEWISADRAMHAAEAAANPLAMAESQRLLASAARRAGHHTRAQELTLAAVDYLDTTSPDASAAHLVMAGTLHCSASYAAARAGDRARATDLLDQAQATARRLDTAPGQQRALITNVVSHRVSAAYVLGDTGTALYHAHSLPISQIPTVERRARLLVDAAMAYAQGSKPGKAYRTLLHAEHLAPGEVRTRGAVRRLVTDLLTAPRQPTMPGVRDLAARIHMT